LVATGSTWVRLGEVRPEGKAMMAAADWARGVRLQSTDAFE
jgi:methionyl-tRNA formyltransferase